MILHQKWGVITSEKEGDSIDLGMGGGEGNGIDLKLFASKSPKYG